MDIHPARYQAMIAQFRRLTTFNVPDDENTLQIAYDVQIARQERRSKSQLKRLKAQMEAQR
jgi:hypothetical protein